MSKHAPITYDLKFITGRAYGQINTHSPDQQITLECEDSERTLKAYLRDGTVVRFNRYTYGGMYVGPGGMAEYRTTESCVASHLRLAEIYPELVSVTLKQAGKKIDQLAKDNIAPIYHSASDANKVGKRELNPVRIVLRFRDKRGVGAGKKTVGARVTKRTAGAGKKEERVVVKKKDVVKKVPVTRVAKDWGVSNMALRSRKPRQP